MGDRIDSKIEDHRRDPDPHPRWRKQLDAQIAVLAEGIAALAPDGEVPVIPDAGTATPQPVTHGVPAEPGSAAPFAREDHRHALVLPPSVEAIANIEGAGVVHRDTAGVLQARQQPDTQVGVWDEFGLTSIEGFTATDELVTAPALKATDQAGTGERMVLAQASGQQRAEDLARWINGVTQEVAAPTWGYAFNGVKTDLAGGNAFGLASNVYSGWRELAPDVWYQGGLSADSASVTVATTGTGDATFCCGLYGDGGMGVPGKYIEIDTGRFRARMTILQHLKLYNQSDVEVYSRAVTDRTYFEIAFVVAAGVLTCYVDGVQVYQGAEPTPTAITSCSIYASGATYGTVACGDVFCWPVALTAAQVGIVRTERVTRPWDVVETDDVLELGPAADFRVLDHAAATQRLQTAEPDGTLTPADTVTVDATTLDIDLIVRANSVRADNQAGTGDRLVIAGADGAQTAPANVGTAGSVGAADQTVSLTTDVQGRVTARSAQAIAIAESQVTNLVSDLAGKAPVTHATTHASGGSDAVKLDDLAAPDDNTDLNASTAQHGLLPKLSGVGTEFMNGLGNWATPAGGGGGVTDHGALTGLADDDHTQYAQKARLPINVKDYGATGNGTTDDYTAIAAAITAAPAGSEVYFPPGTYRIASQITINKSLFLLGDNQNVATIKGDAGIAFGQGALIMFNAFPCGMSDLTVNGQTPTAGYHLVSHATGCTGASHLRCRFTGMNERAALRAGWDGTSGAGRGFITVRDCLFDSGTSAGAIAFYTDYTGKGVDGIEVSGCRMVDVGGPCCAISDQTAAADGKFGGFVNTIFKNNYILANDTGPYGPIPAELWGHDNLQVVGNEVEAGTRGIGIAQCRNSTWANNIVKNQTAYACEIATNRDCVFSGNIIQDCRSFVEDSSSSPDTACQGMTFIGNTIVGSGLATLDTTARCIKANAFAIGTGWKILNNSFKNYINGMAVIDISGIAGSGNHLIQGNTYEVDDPASTFVLAQAYRDGTIIVGNTVRITCDYTNDNPNWGGAGSCFSHDPLTATNSLIADNTVFFSGGMDAAEVYAFGASTATAVATASYVRNRAIGAFGTVISFNGDGTCYYKGNDWSRATGTVDVSAAIRHKADSELFNRVDGAAGVVRSILCETNGLARVAIGAYSDAESGSDGGSRAYCETFDDSGASLGFAWWATRIRTGGVFNIERPQIDLSSASASQDLDLRFSAPSGGYIENKWYEGGVRRMILTKLPGGDFSLAMYNAAGALIDTPITVPNALNGVMAFARPTTITNATACPAPAANQVAISGGNVRIARTSDATTDEVVRGNDSRLTNSRAPSAHASTHNAGGADALAIDAAAATGSLRTLGTAATAACAGNDSRLTNSRTPTAHVLDSASHTISGKTAGQVMLATAATTYGFTTISGDATLSGAGALTIGANKVTLGQMAQVVTATFLGRTTAATGNVEALTVAQAKALLAYTAADVSAVPTSRTVNAGTGLTGGGALSANITLTVAYGATGTTACVGNDSRLSDARTPTSHTIESHTSSDITTLNVDNTKHGLFPKLPSVSDAKYYGIKDGAVAEIPAASVTLATNGEVNASEPPASSDSRLRNPFAFNYITNPDAEIDTTGWATYADAAGAVPVDGTGGSPNITWTRSTSSPRRGTASFLLTKDAANRQGQGVSFAFSIDPVCTYRSQMVRVHLFVASGTYTDGDITAHIYDVNGVAIKASASSYLTANGYTIQFQFVATNPNYRLCLHVATTSASAYTVQVDDVYVGPATTPAVHVEASSDAGQATTQNVTDHQYEDEVVDTHGAWSGSLFTAPLAGTYHLSACAARSIGSAAVHYISIYKNGAAYREGPTCYSGTNPTASVSATIKLAAGETLSVRCPAASYTRTASAQTNHISITRVGD
jgi:hypothetical protein